MLFIKALFTFTVIYKKNIKPIQFPMYTLSQYLTNPFSVLRMGKNKILAFFEDHGARLKKGVANGLPMDADLQTYLTALAQLTDSLNSNAVNRAQQSASTLSVDDLIDAFSNEIKRLEPRVLIHFDKASPEYLAFFPQGKSAYNHVNKKNIEGFFATIITACNLYKEKLGTEPAEVWEALRNNYLMARDAQVQQKGNTMNARSLWDEKLDEVAALAYRNLLLIALQHPNQPDMLSTYFDESILSPRKHKKQEAPANG